MCIRDRYECAPCASYVLRTFRRELPSYGSMEELSDLPEEADKKKRQILYLSLIHIYVLSAIGRFHGPPHAHFSPCPWISPAAHGRCV